MVRQKANNKDERRRNRVKTIILLIFSLILLIIVTIAWFAINKGTVSSGMGVTVNCSSFDLKTTGYYGYFDDWLDTDVGRIAEDLATAGLPTSGTNGSITTENSATIQWLVTDSSNTKNYVTPGTESDNIGIRPGSFGELSFSVVPKEQETVTISFNIEIVPYRANYRRDNDGNLIYDPQTGLPEEDEPTLIEDDPDAVTYLMSHVLFFRDRTTGSAGNYVYSDLIPLNDSFYLVPGNNGYVGTLTFAKVNDVLQDREFTIYWVWPETLAEAVLPSTQQASGKYPICSDDDPEIFNFVKDDLGSYLMGFNAETDLGSASATITQTAIKNHYSKLSAEYNNADQSIGDTVGCFILRLTASAN